MGYMCHHAVLVTSWDDDAIEGAHAFAVDQLDQYDLHDIVSPVSDSVTNGIRSFAVFRDGSKEGWKTSDQGDEFRQALIDALDADRYSDGSSRFDWCLVQYGDDDADNRMLRHENERGAS